MGYTVAIVGATGAVGTQMKMIANRFNIVSTLRRGSYANHQT